MKYKADIFDLKNPHSIGEVEATSIKQLKNVARWYALNYRGCNGRVKVVDQYTGRSWIINF